MSPASAICPGRGTYCGHERLTAPPGPSRSATVRSSVGFTRRNVSERGNEPKVDLAFERRATGLQPVVDADHAARGLEPHAEPDAVAVQRVELVAAALDRHPRSHPR